MNPLILSLLLILFLLLYGGMQYYFYLKFVRVFPAIKQFVSILLILFTLSLFASEFAAHFDAIQIAKPLAWVSYYWMGLVFIFIVLYATYDFLVFLSGILLRRACIANTKRVKVTEFAALSLLTFFLLIYGSISANRYQINTVHISSAKLDGLAQPFRVVQISDLHLGLLSREQWLEGIVKKINELNPDIIVSTGDLIDSRSNHMKALVELLQQLNARYGKYAVMGNHEAYVGISDSMEYLRHAGFITLSYDAFQINQSIQLVGIDDPAIQQITGQSPVRKIESLKNLNNQFFTILLKHQPVLEMGTSPDFDLQLSGHTHGGQIFPFFYLTRLIYREPVGLSKHSGNTYLYVSQGTGTWGPPLRVLAPAEITLFILEGESH